MKHFFRLTLLAAVTNCALAFGLTPDQQRAYDLIDQLSGRVFQILALPNQSAKQAQFCALAQYVDYNKAVEDLVQPWADRYSKTAERQAMMNQDIANFKRVLPSVLSNDMLSLFETLNLIGGGYQMDPRPIAKGSRAVGVHAIYRDAAGKTYDITFIVNTAGAEAKLIDAQTSVVALVSSKQSDYDKVMRTAYDSGKTGYPIGALNTKLESELQFRCP